MVTSCSASKCTNRFGKLKKDGSKLQFHRFPLKKPELLKQWVEAVGRKSWQPTKASFLCAEHFITDCYKSSAQHHLKDNAVPTIFSFPSHVQTQDKQSRPLIMCRIHQNPVISCSALNCTNRLGKLKQDGSKLQFHQFPLGKPEIVKQWVKAVGRKSWKPTKACFLCAEHFTTDCYKSSAPHVLKDNAVPTIFSFPSHLQTQRMRTRSPIIRGIQRNPVISCSALNCTNQLGKLKQDGSKLQFHQFPLKKPEIVKQWVKAVGRMSWKPTEISFLCAEHFTTDCYKSSAPHVLKHDAVPTIFNFPSHLQTQHKQSQPLIIYCIPNSEGTVSQDSIAKTTALCRSELEIATTASSELETATTAPSELEIATTAPLALRIATTAPSKLEIATKAPSELHIATTASSVLETATTAPSELETAPSELEIATTVLSELEIATTAPSELKISTTAPPELAAIALSREANTHIQENGPQMKKPTNPTGAQLRHRIKVLQQKLRRRDKKISHLQSLLSTVQKACGMSMQSDDSLKDTFGDVPFDLLVHQLSNKNKPKGRRYSSSTKDFAMKLYFYSPSSYIYLRKYICLPHPAMLRSWVKSTQTVEKGS